MGHDYLPLPSTLMVRFTIDYRGRDSSTVGVICAGLCSGCPGWHALRYSEGREEVPAASGPLPLVGIVLPCLLQEVRAAFLTPFGVPQGVPPAVHRWVKPYSRAN